MDIKREVHTRVPKISDVEIHVSTLETELGRFAEIREFVVSANDGEGQYGRGITFRADTVVIDAILKGLEQVRTSEDA